MLHTYKIIVQKCFISFLTNENLLNNFTSFCIAIKVAQFSRVHPSYIIIRRKNCFPIHLAVLNCSLSLSGLRSLYTKSCKRYNIALFHYHIPTKQKFALRRAIIFHASYIAQSLKLKYITVILIIL